MEAFSRSIGGLFAIVYFAVGLFQLFAIVDGLDHWLGIGRFFSFILAIIITYIPLVGTIAGVSGAVNAWDWPLWQALALFAGPLLIMLVLNIGVGFLSRQSER